MSALTEILAGLRDALPVPIAVALWLCFPNWLLAEGLAEQLNGQKTRWWGWFLVRAAPILIGVGLCLIPGLVELLREDVLGYSQRDLRPKTVIGYGAISGAFAMVAHAVGLRQVLEAMLRRGVRQLGRVDSARKAPVKGADVVLPKDPRDPPV